MEQEENIVGFHINGYYIRLIKREWEDDIDLDEITKIDYSNLFGEMVTISALLNRVGILKADMEARVREEQLDLEVFEAQKRSEHGKRMVSLGTKYTKQDLEDVLLEDLEVIAKRKKIIQTKKHSAYIDSIYWSVKSKDDKLSVLLKPVTPYEFEESIISSSINGFIIEKHKHRL